MRFAGSYRLFAMLVSAALGLSIAACSGTNRATADDAGDGPETVPECRAVSCGAQCCRGSSCWWVDATGATVQEPPTCSGPDAGPPTGPAMPFAGKWSPVSGSGQESCTDGESTALPPDTTAVLTFVQTGPSTLEVYGAGDASSCSMELRVGGNVASEASANPSCVIPGTNGVTVYYPKFQVTLNAPDSGAGGSELDGGIAEGGNDGGAAGTGVTLTWQLESTFTDAVKTCTSSLEYTLAPAL